MTKDEETNTTTATTSNVYQDLIGFLQSDRSDLRLAASEAVMGVTDEKGRINLIQEGVIQPLCKLSSQCLYEKAGLNALKTLVQLSSAAATTTETDNDNDCTSYVHYQNQCTEELLDRKCINRMTEIALSNPSDYMNPDDDESGRNSSDIQSLDDSKKEEEWKQRVNYAVALLANMTRSERGCIEFCGFTMPMEAVPSSSTASDAATATARTTQTEGETTLPSRPTMALLTSRFLSHDYCEDYNNENDDHGEEDDEERMSSNFKDPYQHFAAVLMNATQIEQGRRFIMKLHHSKRRNNKDTNCERAKDEEGTENVSTTISKTTSSSSSPTSILQRLLPQLQSSNPIRRRGIAGIIKNCCLGDRDSIWWLLHDPNIKILSKILWPLVGPEEMDLEERLGMDPDLWLHHSPSSPSSSSNTTITLKQREEDDMTRLLLIECILVLCASGRRNRATLRLAKTYVVLKYANMVEEREDISDRIDECVQFLRRDEEGTKEGSSDLFVENAYNPIGKKEGGLSASDGKDVGSSRIGREDDYNDVD